MNISSGTEATSGITLGGDGGVQARKQRQQQQQRDKLTSRVALRLQELSGSQQIRILKPMF